VLLSFSRSHNQPYSKSLLQPWITSTVIHTWKYLSRSMISVVIGNLYMLRIVDVLHHHKIRASVVGYAHKLAVIRTEQIPHRVWTSPSSPFSQTRLREQEARPGRLRHCTRFHTVMPRTHRRTATLEIFSWRSQTKKSRVWVNLILRHVNTSNSSVHQGRHLPYLIIFFSLTKSSNRTQHESRFFGFWCMHVCARHDGEYGLVAFGHQIDQAVSHQDQKICHASLTQQPYDGMINILGNTIVTKTQTAISPAVKPSQQ
jgi:hypothetical protein